MLTCRQCRSALSDLHDGQISGVYRWLVKLHLFVCRPCRRVNASLHQTVSKLRALAADDDDDRRSDG
jgi:predicted anti-sigma-YlaC factor YlaD